LLKTNPLVLVNLHTQDKKTKTPPEEKVVEEEGQNLLLPS